MSARMGGAARSISRFEVYAVKQSIASKEVELYHLRDSYANAQHKVSTLAGALIVERGELISLKNSLLNPMPHSADITARIHALQASVDDLTRQKDREQMNVVKLYEEYLSHAADLNRHTEYLGTIR